MKRHTVVEKIMGNDLFSAKKELMERASTVAALIYDSKREEIARSIFEAKDKIKMDGEEVKLKKSKKKVDDDEELDEEILDECLAELSEEYDFDISELDEEQLDELSNELLGRYVKKAHLDGGAHSYVATKSAERAWDNIEKGKTKHYNDPDLKKANYHRKKEFKRTAGIEKAVDKMTKKKV